MMQLKTKVFQLFRKTDGVTSLEYALIAALIAVVIIGAVTALGTNLNALYQDIADKVGNAISGAV